MPDWLSHWNEDEPHQQRSKMPDWKDELSTEVADLQATVVLEGPDRVTKHLSELCMLILELIDHIPEEQEPK